MCQVKISWMNEWMNDVLGIEWLGPRSLTFLDIWFPLCKVNDWLKFILEDSLIKYKINFGEDLVHIKDFFEGRFTAL